MATKKYTVLNEKYGDVNSEASFSEIKKNAAANDADTDLTEDTLADGRSVVRDSHNVIVAEIRPEGERQGLSGGVVNRDRDKEQPAAE